MRLPGGKNGLAHFLSSARAWLNWGVLRDNFYSNFIIVVYMSKKLCEVIPQSFFYAWTKI